jgi:hypothetical protein
VVKDDLIGDSFSTFGRFETHKITVREPEGKHHFEDVGLDGRIVLR